MIETDADDYAKISCEGLESLKNDASIVENAVKIVESLSLNKNIQMVNVGLHADRLNSNQHNPREAAFAEQWEFEQTNNHILNYLVGKGKFKEITTRDREVAATVIQWLGTTVGLGFLIEVMRKEPEVRKYLHLST